LSGECSDACIEAYICRGHPNISMRHETTLELAEEARLTPRGDCIVCVELKPLTGMCRLRFSEAYGVLRIFFADPDGRTAVYTCSGRSPADPRGTGHVARRSGEPARSMLVFSDCSAAAARRVLEERGVDYRSPFTRVMAVLYYIACSVNPVDVAARGVVDDPPRPDNPAPPRLDRLPGLGTA